MNEEVQIRVHGAASLPTLIYLPGLHGDWTLIGGFRKCLAGRVRFVECTYPYGGHWTLPSLTAHILEKLGAHGITGGWLLGESFGSQPAWEIIRQCVVNPAPGMTGRFEPRGLILAGGFVQHPLTLGVRFLQAISRRISASALEKLCKLFVKYAAYRHPDAAERLGDLRQFAANRCRPEDRQAITHRYGLIAESDLKAVARATTLPVYYVAGFFDPLVPWPYVRWWLRRNCPGYRGGRTFWRADHSVLVTEPAGSAEQLLAWITEGKGGGTDSHPQ